MYTEEAVAQAQETITKIQELLDNLNNNAFYELPKDIQDELITISKCTERVTIVAMRCAA